MSEPVAPLDHYRPTDDQFVPSGVYRVVGHSNETVTLLHVADEQGRRVHTGRVETVPEETLETAFVPTANPDDVGVWSERLASVLRAAGLALVLVGLLARLDLFAAPATPGTLALVGLVLLGVSYFLDRRGLPSIRG